MRQNLFSLRLKLLTFFLAATTFPAWSQWDHLPGPDGGSVRQFDRDGDDLFALTFGGIYKSPDNGVHWALLEGSLPLGWTGVQFQAENGKLYLLNEKGEVWRSTDAGKSWTAVFQRPYPVAGPGERLLQLFAAGDTVLIGSVATIYRSGDAGNSWQKTIDLFAQQFRGFGSVRSDLFAAYDRYILKSADGGLNWSQNFSAGTFFAGLTAVDTTLYALYDGYPRLIRSADQGAHWDKIDADTIRFLTYNDETDDWLTGEGQNLYYSSDYWCTHGGVLLFHSPDRGKSWSTAGQTGLRELQLRDLLAVPGGVLAGTLQGVYRSGPGGKAFQTSQEGMNATWVRDLFRTQNNRWWANTRQGVFSSDDDGQSWTFRLPGELADPCLWGYPFHKTGKRLFHKNYTSWPILTQMSEDNGESWSPLPVGPIYADPLIQTTDDAAWFLYDNQLYRLRDDRQTVETVYFPYLGEISDLYAKGNRMIVSGPGQDFLSLDGGVEWTAIPQIPFSYGYLNVDEYSAVRRVWGIADTLFYLDYDKKTWQPYFPVDAVTGDTIQPRDIWMYESAANLHWIGVSGRGLYYAARQQPDRLYPFYPELAGLTPTAMHYAGGECWIGTAGAGIFRTALNFKSAENPGPGFTLFPNPATGEALQLISDLFLPESPQLRVFDAAGRLVHERALPPGQQWTLDLPGLPSGVYVFQLLSAGNTAALKWVRH